VQRSLAVLATFILTGCAGLTAPKTFLHTDAKTTTDWLNEFVEIDLRNVPLADLPRRGAFQGLHLIFGDVDGNAVVSLEASHVTRRQALWLLAEKYGLTMAVTRKEGYPLAIVITNRESRPENKPLK
jgi:hypothetical protein